MAVQSTANPRAERFTIGEDRYRIIAYAALATLTLIIWTGAAVRLTGSGLGCARWPNCEAGHLLPPLSGHALIEFGNRMVTGVVGLPCILAAVGAFRLRPFRRDLVVPACILPVGVAAQAVLGGITVLLDLSWEVVIVHYLLSAALLVAAVVLVWRLRRGTDTAQEINPRAAVFGTRALVVFGWLIIVAGTFATAAGPHAGGAGTGDYVARLDALGTNTLRQLIHLHGHAAAVMGFASIALFFLARHLRAKPLLLGALATVCVAMGIQGTVGLIQYHEALPSWLVWIHASLAALVWIVLVFSWLAAGAPRRNE